MQTRCAIHGCPEPGNLWETVAKETILFCDSHALGYLRTQAIHPVGRLEVERPQSEKKTPQCDQRFAKTCAYCGQTFYRPVWKGKLQVNRFWQQKRFCSTPCSNRDTMRRASQRAFASIPQRVCASCGKPLVLRHNEQIWNFRVRQTCGMGACRNALIAHTKFTMNRERERV